jgi:hypothetical protein
MPVTRLPIKPGTITAVAQSCPSREVTYSINAVAAATSYRWTKPANTQFVGDSTTSSVVIRYPFTSVRGKVSVIALNACGSSSARSLNVSISACDVSVANIEVASDLEAEFKTGANPTNSEFEIFVSNTFNVFSTLKVVDLTGRVIETRSYTSLPNSIKFGNNYRSGFYIAEIRYGTKQKIFKLIKH